MVVVQVVLDLEETFFVWPVLFREHGGLVVTVVSPFEEGVCPLDLRGSGAKKASFVDTGFDGLVIV